MHSKTEQAPSRILRRRQVEDLTGLSRSSIYREIEYGRFPRPVRLTAQSVGWRETDIDQWLESRPTTDEAAVAG